MYCHVTEMLGKHGDESKSIHAIRMPDDKADHISVPGGGVCPVGQEPPLEQPREMREERKECWLELPVFRPLCYEI